MGMQQMISDGVHPIHDLRKSRVAAATNSGPPSEESSSGIPYVTKLLRKVSMSPLDPPEAFSTMGQLEYLSTITR